MAEQNVIQVTIQAIDQITSVLKGIEGNTKQSAKAMEEAFGGVGTAITKLNEAFVAFTAAAATFEIFNAVREGLNKFIDLSAEAEQAMIRLDVSFRNFGVSAQISKDQLTTFSRSVELNTGFTEEAANDAQAILLRFEAVSGGIFDRAQGDLVNLAATMRGSLSDAATVLGRALENPDLAMRSLRQAGIVLTPEMRDQIKVLGEAGEKYEQMALILDIVEGKTHDVGDALSQSFTESLKQLKNAMAELFKQPGAIDQFSQSLRDMAEFLQTSGLKEAIGDIAKAMGEIVAQSAKVITLKPEREAFSALAHATAPLATGGGEGATNPNVLTVDEKEQQKLLDAGPITGMSDNERAQFVEKTLQPIIDEISQQETEGNDAIKQFEDAYRKILEKKAEEFAEKLARDNSEFQNAIRTMGVEFSKHAETTLDEQAKKESKARQDAIEEQRKFGEEAFKIADDIATPIQKVIDKYDQYRSTLQKIVDLYQSGASGITRDQFLEAQAVLEKLPAAEDDAIAKVENRLDGTAQFARRAASQFSEAFVSAFQNMNQGARGFLVTMLDVLRKILLEALAMDLERAIGLDKILAALGSSGGSSFIGSLLGGLFKGGGSTNSSITTGGDTIEGGDSEFFAAASAGGTDYSAGGPTWVGEEGPELMFLPAGAKIKNQRQLQFAGATGGQLHYAPQTSIVINGAGGDLDKLEAKLYGTIALNNHQQKKDVLDLLYANGFGRLR